MKHLTKFETNDVFNILKSSLDLPNISLIKETNEINFLPYVEQVEKRLICTYSSWEPGSQVPLISTYGLDGNPNYPEDVVSLIEIDGIEQQSFDAFHTFETKDNHIIKYTLIDPTTITDYMFQGYSEYTVYITDVIIPNNVTSIGNCAFSYCIALGNVTFSNNLTSIGNYAFDNCSLENIILPNSLINIGEGAFMNNNLTSITCLASIPPTLGEYVFDEVENTDDCPIYVPSESVNTYKSADGWSKYSSRIQAIS